MKTLKVKKLSTAARMPARATEHSAGYDLYACISESLVVPAHGRTDVPTGISVEIEPGYVGLVFGRSGLGTRHGIVPANAVGVIDSDYRGEVVVCLANHSDDDYAVASLERVAQLVIVPIACPEIVECDELSRTERGTGGFGSTGK